MAPWDSELKGLLKLLDLLSYLYCNMHKECPGNIQDRIAVASFLFDSCALSEQHLINRPCTGLAWYYVSCAVRDAVDYP